MVKKRGEKASYGAPALNASEKGKGGMMLWKRGKAGLQTSFFSNRKEEKRRERTGADSQRRERRGEAGEKFTSDNSG